MACTAFMSTPVIRSAIPLDARRYLTVVCSLMPSHSRFRLIGGNEQCRPLTVTLLLRLDSTGYLSAGTSLHSRATRSKIPALSASSSGRCSSQRNSQQQCSGCSASRTLLCRISASYRHASGHYYGCCDGTWHPLPALTKTRAWRAQQTLHWCWGMHRHTTSAYRGCSGCTLRMSLRSCGDCGNIYAPLFVC